ncbi:aspartic peptidase domain-containing protein [Mycena vulgaris]|nr:aspartic peptidase domain-containing protein [Mycena vulgaris]
MLFSAVLPSVFLLLTKPSPASANGRDQQPSRPSDIDDTIFNSRNNRYSTSVTIAGTPLHVNIDTGSTDMWVNPPGGIGAFEDTGVVKNISYGTGSTHINGTIGLAQVSIAGYTIPHQAFINVTQNVGLDECGSGNCGLIGLGFDSPTAGIQKALSTAGLDGPGLGKSVLFSIFDMNPTKGRFFALALSRLGDTTDTANASLSISEYEPQYADVQWRARHPVFPATAKSWHTLSDGVSVNGVSIPWTANDEGTPSGQKSVWLDSGTSNILVRPEVRDRIYSAVPGAVLAKNSSIGNQGHWSGDQDVWVVPCNTSASFTVYFGGQPYPIHPLDFMSLSTKVGPDGVNYTICVGSITNGGSITTGKTDAMFGDTFLRNVYTVFSFGDNTTSPFVQFLPLTNEWESSQDFISVRQQILAKNPPELAPADLIRVFDGPSASISTPSSPGQSPAGGSSSSDVPDPSSGSACPSTTGRVAAGNLAAADGASSTDSSTVAKYAPIIIGLLGANLVILLVLVFLGVMTFVRRSRQIGLARAPGSRYVPARIKDESLLAPSFDEEKRYSDI